MLFCDRRTFFVKITRAGMYSLAVGAIALTIAGCGGPKKETSVAPAPEASTPGGKPVDAATAGSITGTVVLEGTPPRMKKINMSAEPSCMKERTGPAFSEEVVTGDGGALANVVIYVKSGLAGYSFPPATTPVEIDQKGCQYIPHVIALQAGQPLKIVNSDPTTHNIHAMPVINQAWNESEPPGVAPIDKTFTHDEIGIPVKCSVHPWMKAYLSVLSNPYFQVTGKDGAFDLKNMPPGTYTLVAWQELYGTQEQTVTIGPKETKNVKFTFKAAASGN